MAYLTHNLSDLFVYDLHDHKQVSDGVVHRDTCIQAETAVSIKPASLLRERFVFRKVLIHLFSICAYNFAWGQNWVIREFEIIQLTNLCLSLHTFLPTLLCVRLNIGATTVCLTLIKGKLNILDVSQRYYTFIAGHWQQKYHIFRKLGRHSFEHRFQSTTRSSLDLFLSKESKIEGCTP